MNLYEFSQQHNREMGVLIDIENENDKQVYEDASNDIESIMHNSEDFSYVQAPQKTINENVDYKPSLSKSSNRENKNRYSKSKLLTTKELSQKTGLSSRKVNSWFVDNKFMYKKDDDWYATKKGNEFGAKQKEGAYGKFIVWPEEIADEIE